MRLSSMVNIGPKLEMLLLEAGIEDADMLREMGSIEAAYRLCQKDQDCVNKLFAIEGAIRGTRWHSIDKEERTLLLHRLEERLSLVAG